LNFGKELPTSQFTEPCFSKSRDQFSKQQESPANLSVLMHISEKLADLNWERNCLKPL
jgi:cytoplasmic iron level regulating protein YaaA (DUF328/UPF0246 family)